MAKSQQAPAHVDLTYTGGSPVACGWPGGGIVDPGETIRVDRARADELLARGEWKLAAKGSAKDWTDD